jgi:ATP-binding cassette subfamily B protein
VAIILAVTLAVGGLNAAEPLLLKAVIDELLGGRQANALIALIGGLLAIYLTRDFGTGVANWLTWRTRLRVQHRLLDETVGRLHALSVAYHRNQAVGSLLTRLDRGIQGLVAAFSDIAFSVVPALVFLGLSAILMLRLDWRLSLLVFVFVPLPPSWASTPPASRRAGIGGSSIAGRASTAASTRS